jgi:isopentenyl-diphosphate delta-isomerase
MNRTVTLTDEKGSPIGEAEIVDAHTNGGKLHRAISVYVFDASGKKILLQKRSSEKMLFKGIWANTCCSHPFPGEDAVVAGERRLKEEMGFTCTLKEGPAFVYRADDPKGNGTEHEYDIILVGTYDSAKKLTPDPKEAEAYTWKDIDSVCKEMKTIPYIYAPWFHLGLPKALAFINA